MKTFFGNFNAAVGTENIFKPTVGNESSHKIINDSEVIVAKFATLKKSDFQ
jgi:hypothetical protein